MRDRTNASGFASRRDLTLATNPEPSAAGPVAAQPVERARENSGTIPAGPVCRRQGTGRGEIPDVVKSQVVKRGLRIGQLRGIRPECEQLLIVGRRQPIILSQQEHGEHQFGQPRLRMALGFQDGSDQADIISLVRVWRRDPLFHRCRKRPGPKIRETDSRSRMKVGPSAHQFVNHSNCPLEVNFRRQTCLGSNDEPAKVTYYTATGQIWRDKLSPNLRRDERRIWRPFFLSETSRSFPTVQAWKSARVNGSGREPPFFLGSCLCCPCQRATIANAVERLIKS